MVEELGAPDPGSTFGGGLWRYENGVVPVELEVGAPVAVIVADERDCGKQRAHGEHKANVT